LLIAAGRDARLKIGQEGTSREHNSKTPIDRRRVNPMRTLVKGDAPNAPSILG